METKIEVRIEAAKIAATMSGDFKENFDIVYHTILCGVDIPDVSPIPKMREEVLECIKNIIGSYEK